MPSFKISILCSAIALLISCEPEPEKPQITAQPECSDILIASGEAREGDFPIVEVWRWETEDTQYYYTVSECCDAFNYLYDSGCNLICSPDGGIAGQGDGTPCPDIPEDTEKTLLWQYYP